jgi:hypothetical protein
MDVEGWILLLMVVGVPGSTFLFVRSALRSGMGSACTRPVWIVLLEGRQEDDNRGDWEGGGEAPPPKPRVPSNGASGPLDGGECRRRRMRERAAITRVGRMDAATRIRSRQWVSTSSQPTLSEKSGSICS